MLMLRSLAKIHFMIGILDKKKVYISGMSLKDIGKKYSYINKVQEEIFINELLKRISDMI